VVSAGLKDRSFEALDHEDGNVSAAARSVGLNCNTAYGWIRRHERLLVLRRTLGMDLILVWHAQASPARLALDTMPHRITHRLADVTDHLTAAAPTDRAAAGLDRRPLLPLPNVDADRLRAVVYEQLPRAESDRVTTLYDYGRADGSPTATP
jgi:hypothetical protein